MKRFWTADFHIGHYNKNGGILAYCNRPFKDLDHMNKSLIHEANMRVKESDTCIHVGDFAVKSNADKFVDLRNQLRGNWTFVEGNHDKNNGVKCECRWMFVKISHFNVFVSHIPYFYDESYDTPAEWLIPHSLVKSINLTCDFAICGHVHEKWKHVWHNSIPTINVGCDVWNYRPVSDDELVKYYLKECR
jgi:calcineurin-like phosphoesterase family protein